MTVAHNIYKIEEGGMAEKIVFYPSDKTDGIQNNSAVPYEIKTYFFDSQYKNQNLSNDDKLKYDYAFLELQKKIGQFYGWFGLDLNIKKSQIQSKQAYLYGYPGDFGEGTQLNYKIVGHSGQIRQCDENRRTISYKISTTDGQSGSPVFRKIKGLYFVVGIHSSSGNKNQNFNIGYFINKKNLMIEQIRNKFLNTMKNFQADLSGEGIPESLIANSMKIKLPTILKNNLNLKILQLSYCHIGKDGIRTIVDAQLLLLETLILNNNSAGKEGAQILSSGRWFSLIELKIGSNRIQAQGALHISRGCWKQLILLYIENNEIGSQGIQNITKARWPLQFLNVEQNNIDKNDVKKIMDNFEKLKRLKLNKNKMTNQQIIDLTRIRNLQTD